MGRDHLQNSWEWLPESIEMSRVYATIENFPVDDTALPKCCLDNEALYSEPDGEGNLEKQRNENRRYSPGFLLPLILASLDDEGAIAPSNNWRAQSLHNSVAARRQGPLFLQRLYEKGAIALAVCALSSSCPLLRKISVAIIGLFTTALNREEARKSVSWHYRPQIEMLLHSIQRSLVLRLSDENKNNSHESIEEVPQLPGFSAVFLARASLILFHPADPLYQAINRAFLRSEEDAGGFQDLTRLPVFVALFCSSADTPDQLSAERRFALNLVKDGFTDPNNYKLLMQCHCPELILTSIDFALVRSSFGFDDDLQTLFVTLTKIITYGADRAASHLLSRLGLVSWARAFLFGNYISSNMLVRVAFLKMLTAILDQGKHYDTVMPIDDFVAATRGIAQHILAFALEQPSCQSNGNEPRTNIGPLLHYTCEILYILSQAQNAINYDNHSTDAFQIHCQSDGIQVKSAIRFVDELRPHSNYFIKAIVSICILPIQFQAADTSSLRRICNLLVDEYGSLQTLTTESKLAVFRRLHFISESMQSVANRTNDVLQCLLLWRSDCVSCSKLRKVWYDIMKTLVPVNTNSSDQTIDFLECTSNESLLPLYIVQRENDLNVVD